MEVMSRYAVIERASIDEAYLDLTQAIQERLKKMKGQPISKEQLGTTYVQGFPNSLEEEETRDNKGSGGRGERERETPFQASYVFWGIE